MRIRESVVDRGLEDVRVVCLRLSLEMVVDRVIFE